MHNIKYFRLICLTILTITFISCGEEFLDVSPKGQILIKNTNDIRLLLDQVEADGNSDGIVFSFTNDFYRSDDISIPSISATSIYPETINNFTWQENIYDASGWDRDWMSCYSQIYVSNLILEEIDDLSGPESQKKLLAAEARVHRAWAYFILASLYCKPYNASTASSDLGLPLRLETTLTGSLKRVSLERIYEQIFSDLELAFDDLPEKTDKAYNHRPTKAGVYAILARIYLSIADYDRAKENAINALNIKNTLHNYNDFEENNAYEDKAFLPKPLEDEEQYICKMASRVPYSLEFAMSQSLIESYETDVDLRFRYRFHSDPYFDDPEIFTLIELLITEEGVAFGPSVAEMILIKAECLAREGDFSNAMIEINTLRESRFEEGVEFELSATTPEEALQIVKEERRRELSFKGHRWFDLRRYNAYDNANIAITHEFDGTSYTLEPSSPRWVLPIAMLFIAMNPEIEQNPQ
jgi:starch-binding outer membrane protein, SusD/RagB family